MVVWIENGCIKIGHCIPSDCVCNLSSNLGSLWFFLIVHFLNWSLFKSLTHLLLLKITKFRRLRCNGLLLLLRLLKIKLFREGTIQLWLFKLTFGSRKSDVIAAYSERLCHIYLRFNFWYFLFSVFILAGQCFWASQTVTFITLIQHA